MLTKITDFKAHLEKARPKNRDLIAVCVQDRFKAYFNDRYLEELDKYCHKFDRVYQVCGGDKPDREFPNQVESIELDNLGVDADTLQQLLPEDVANDVIGRMASIGIEQGEVFDTVAGERLVYVGLDRAWFLCDLKMTKLLETLKAQGRGTVLVGGSRYAGIMDIYWVLVGFGIEVEVDEKFVYGEDGCGFDDAADAGKVSEMRSIGNGPKGKDLSVFVRFGGLDLKRQDGYSQEDRIYHAPPASRGFYAMPKVAQEHFLISSIDDYQPGVFPKEKHPPENLTGDEISKFYDEQSKTWDKRLQEIRKEFRKTDGLIWHHLGGLVPNNEIESRHGSWVKTTVAAWRKAFNKNSIRNRYGEDSFTSNSINNTRGINGMYSMDELEVFFDEKV